MNGGGSGISFTRYFGKMVIIASAQVGAHRMDGDGNEHDDDDDDGNIGPAMWCKAR